MADEPKLRIIDAAEWMDVPPRPRREDPRISLDDTPVKQRGDPLGTEWWRGRQWSVTEDGIERRDGTYFIGKERLLEDYPEYSWPEHMAGKIWVDVDEFTTAWLVGLVLHGYEELQRADLLAVFGRLRP